MREGIPILSENKALYPTGGSMETVVEDIKFRFRYSGLRDACLDAYKTKLDLLNKLGFGFEADNPRLKIEVGTKEDQLLARLREYPRGHFYNLHSMFHELMAANNIRTLVLDANNNIVMPTGTAVRLSVFTKYCQDPSGNPYFDWQAINAFNLGSGLYLTIHPVDFANCSNKEDGITLWHSCFSPDGEYAGSLYAYINSPDTIMVMKGSPDSMVGRMWLHILYNDSGRAAGYCLMRSYGADFSHSELWAIQATLSAALQLDLRCVDSCDIVTNNEVNSHQSYHVSSTDSACYVYFDPISKVYLGRDFDKELHLTIERPFDIYGDEMDCCDGNEFRRSEDDDDSITICEHCHEGYNTDNEGTYLEDYERDVCDYCLNHYYSYINDTYVDENDVEDAYTIDSGGNVTTMSLEFGH